MQMNDGEPGGTRTHDQGLKRPLLYRLSYRLTLPARGFPGRAGRTLGRHRPAVNTCGPQSVSCVTVRRRGWPHDSREETISGENT